MKKARIVQALDGVTATATSKAIGVKYADKVTLQLTRADHSSGSSAFSVTGTVDGTNYVTLNNIVSNVANTNVQGLTRVASVTLSADGSELASLDLENMGLVAIKVTVTETADGTHSATVFIEE